MSWSSSKYVRIETVGQLSLAMPGGCKSKDAVFLRQRTATLLSCRARWYYWRGTPMGSIFFRQKKAFELSEGELAPYTIHLQVGGGDKLR
jgi:hypothetical protein